MLPLNTDTCKICHRLTIYFSVNLLLISSVWFSTFRKMLVFISQLFDYFKSNRNKELLKDNIRNLAKVQGSNLCLT